MRRKLTILAALLIAGQTAQAKVHRRKPKQKPAPPPAQAPAPTPQPAPVVPPPPPPPPDFPLLGAALTEDGAGVAVRAVLPDSPASRLGLEPGDRLLSLLGQDTPTLEQAGKALERWPLNGRLFAVVRRDVRVLERQTELREPGEPVARGAEFLSAREQALAATRRASAASRARLIVSVEEAPSFKIHARQSFWLRFPKGIPDSLSVGDILEGETTTAVSTNADLDFLSLAPKSRVWAKAIDVAVTPAVRRARLVAFALQPVGGHPYPVFGVISEALGDQKLARVSAGGTLVAAAPAAAGARAPIAGPDVRLRAELLDGFTLTEPPSFFLAGPGLWIRTRPGGDSRLFEISHVIPGRSADHLGLKVGELLTSIGGRSASKLDFVEALAELYGPPGTTVRLSVAAAPGDKPRVYELVRGVVFQNDKPVRLPLPTQAL